MDEYKFTLDEINEFYLAPDISYLPGQSLTLRYSDTAPPGWITALPTGTLDVSIQVSTLGVEAPVPLHTHTATVTGIH